MRVAHIPDFLMKPNAVLKDVGMFRWRDGPMLRKRKQPKGEVCT
jgi:hypothetical protein